MTKNSRILIGIFLVLAAVTGAVVYFQQKKADPVFVDPLLKDRDFAYPNISEIDLISIKRKKYPKLIFTKNTDGWLINDKFKASEETMPHLLAVLRGVKMKFIPAPNMLKTIQQDIKNDGIEIELYKNKTELVKHYFVGTEFGDGSDTPFLMAGSTQPFMMYLPGLDGSVRRRLNYNIGEWKSKIVFQEEADKIKKIEVIYPQDLSSSFSITKFNDDYKIFDSADKTPTQKPNKNTLAAYFDFYSFMRGESNESENPERSRIDKSQVFASIIILFSDNTSKKYTFYSMGDLNGGAVTKGPNNIHPDNKFFIEMPDGEMLLAQYRVIGKVLKPIWYFF